MPPDPVPSKTVLVCGSRDWPSARAWEIAHALDTYASLKGGPEHIHVVHGAARGADTMAMQAARKLGISEEPYPADWKKHGKAAGFLRNLQMLDLDPDLVMAFQINGSRGTQHTINEARRREIDVVVYT